MGNSMSDWNYGRPTDERYEAPRPSWPDGTTYPYPLPFPLPQAVDDDEIGPAIGVTAPAGSEPPAPDRVGDSWADDAWASDVAGEPVRYERDPFDTTAPQPAVPPYGPSYPWPPAPYPAGLRGPQDAEDPADPGGGRGHAGRRWLIPAALVAGGAAVGAVALVMMTGGQPGTPGKGALASPSAMPSMAVVRVSKSPSAHSAASASSSAPPSVQTGAPLTLTQAQAVLANYTAANNSANAQRSEAQLATIESGSSNAIDAGLYLEQQAAGTTPYPAFGPVQATYYIPGNEPAAGPRWFVVQVANAFQSSPATVTSDEYLLFTQSAPGGGWQNAIEPYLLASANPPQVKVGADGQATAVSPEAAGVAVAPGQLPATTAAALDGTGAGGASTGTAAVADPGNLADRTDQRRWQTEVTNATVTDTHTAAAGVDGQEFALLTADGGALVFYTDAAEVTVTPPAGSLLRLTVPGFYSASQPLTKATVSYLEQFAAYDPPAGGGAPRVVADYSGITGKN
jgi:hypothetical protein